jgi:hypothetical protein
MDVTLYETNLSDMQIVDKISAVKVLVNKLRENEEYSTQVKLPEDYDLESFITQALNTADLASSLTDTNEIDRLHDQERVEAYANLSIMLDNILVCFPEFKLEATQSLR